MRRMGTSPALLALLVLVAGTSLAQDGKINTRIPPPPPPPPAEEIPVRRSAPVEFASTLPMLPPVPAFVTLASGSRVGVVLDTPLSTRISKKGQRVAFRSQNFVDVSDGLQLPPETEFVGTVIDARRPGAFGKPGSLQVKLERIELPGGTRAPMRARLESPDANAQGKISADKNGSANIMDMAQWAILGTLGGYQVAGGKGAGYGAATGAAIGLIIMAARRGPDLYLEPGMPFTLILDQEVALPGPEVQSAHMDYARRNGLLHNNGTAASTSAPMSEDGASRVDPANRPVLKRRPKP